MEYKIGEVSKILNKSLLPFFIFILDLPITSVPPLLFTLNPSLSRVIVFSFLSVIKIPESFIKDIIDEAAKQKIKPRDDKELQATLPQLKLQLKALVARDLWDMSEYFQIINESNPIVMKAVKLMVSQ